MSASGALAPRRRQQYGWMSEYIEQLLLRLWERGRRAEARHQWLVSGPQLADAAVLVALYWVARDGGLTELAVAAAVVEAGAIMAAARWSPARPLRDWVGLTGLTVAAAGLGVTVRLRRALVASLHERAARLESERDQEGRIGAAAERARIAREVHDIVSHNLTVMISLANGATYAISGVARSSASASAAASASARNSGGKSGWSTNRSPFSSSRLPPPPIIARRGTSARPRGSITA